MSTESRMKIDPLIGQIIRDRYRVLRTLGKGDMGTVYLAEQLNSGQRVVLKILHGQYARNEEFVGRFRSEVQQAASLSHPRVVTIHEFGQLEDGSLFIATEYAAGKTLRELLQEELLPVERAVALGLHLAEALQATHQAGLLHRAVKPENIRVRESDDLKLLDLGLARPGSAEMPTRLTPMGMSVGTPEYLAPEQIQGRQATEQTDIYAWGIVFYEMLTGAVPFSAPTPEVMFAKHLQEMPQPVRKLRSEVPERVERTIMQALEKQAENRQRTMGAVIAQLRGETIPVTGGNSPGEAMSAQSEGAAVQVTGTNRPGTGAGAQPQQAAGSGRAWLLRGAALLGAAVVGAVVVWFAALREGGDLSPGGSISREVESAPAVPETPKSSESPAKVQGTEPAQAGLPQPPSPPQPTQESVATEAEKPEIADHLRLGTFYLDRGQYEEAIAEFEAAKALAPNEPEVLTNLARAQKALEAENRIRRAR
jgi:serine/threonine-protein kinase